MMLKVKLMVLAIVIVLTAGISSAHAFERGEGRYYCIPSESTRHSGHNSSFYSLEEAVEDLAKVNENDKRCQYGIWLYGKDSNYAYSSDKAIEFNGVNNWTLSSANYFSDETSYPLAYSQDDYKIKDYVEAGKLKGDRKGAGSQRIITFPQVGTSEECAITFNAGTNIVVKDIKINAGGRNGICFIGTSNIIIHNVEVRNANVAFVFKSESDVKIKGNNAVHTSKKAFQFSNAHLPLFPFVLKSGAMSGGINIFENKLQVHTLTIDETDSETSSLARAIIDGAGDHSIKNYNYDISSDPQDMSKSGYIIEGTVDPKVTRILMITVTGDKGEFYGVIEKATTNLTEMNYGLFDDGTFLVFIPDDKVPDGSIALIPLIGNKPGKASEEFSLGGSSTGFGGGNDDLGRTTEAILRGFDRKEECEATYKFFGGNSIGRRLRMDSDGDGISDEVEDANGNCICDPWETCYLKADTDDDGILDTLEDACTELRQLQTAVIEGRESDGIQRHCSKIPAQIKKDTSGNVLHYLNANNPDRDQDGMLDGQEDRFWYFTDIRGDKAKDEEGFDGLLYFASGNARQNPLMDESDKAIRCAVNSEVHNLGVSYQLMSYKEISSTKMGEMVEGKINDGEHEVALFECRHIALVSSLNFNGRFDDANIELKFDDADSNKLTYADIDNLPCKGESTIKYAIAVGVNARYLDYGTTGKGKSVKFLEDSNGIPLFLKDAKKNTRSFIKNQACFGDIDLDGIQDCLEAPTMTGSCGEADQITLLTPLKKDVLIEMPELNDIKYYDDMQEEFKMVLGWFMDRDGDELYDIQEDHNLNGVVDIAEICLPHEKRASTCILPHEAESNPLKLDTDDDGVSDKIEIEKWFTNPNSIDTDGDGLADAHIPGIQLGEIRMNADGTWPTNLKEILKLMPDGSGCVADVNTNPLHQDTDGDDIPDGIEVKGQEITESQFLDMLGRGEIFKAGGTNIYSNPRAYDSDADGLSDGEETGNMGKVGFLNSNPCMVDSDDDGRNDNTEEIGCRLVSTTPCKGYGFDASTIDYTGHNGTDSDMDGITDQCELILGTNPAVKDSDKDALEDGEEVDESKGCYVGPDETDPTNPDSDGDGIPDGIEVKGSSKTDPINPDSDGDCIADGVEDANQNGRLDTGETDPNKQDTDGDGLPDGLIPGKGGEDINCNGVIELDEFGRPAETDPINWDSDYDGISDFEEMWSGGAFQLANISRATTQDTGCSMGGNNMTATGILFLMPMFAMLTSRIRSLRRKEEEGAN